ncbi:hypothetical protein ACFQ3S_02890 [Mucilaginibacter terrae]|uniref:hypothetical protein n=1 Tax=Mucilaginibacter terrae TaxID=1955052 RepID=UPI0036432F9F
MHLAYSALQNNAGIVTPVSTPGKTVHRKLKLRYIGYQAACQKYEQEITAIQQYLPGWYPAFK